MWTSFWGTHSCLLGKWGARCSVLEVDLSAFLFLLHYMEKGSKGSLHKCPWDGDPTGWSDFVRRTRLLYERFHRRKTFGTLYRCAADGHGMGGSPSCQPSPIDPPGRCGLFFGIPQRPLGPHTGPDVGVNVATAQVPRDIDVHLGNPRSRNLQTCACGPESGPTGVEEVPCPECIRQFSRSSWLIFPEQEIAISCITHSRK